ncbi:hypothetical protein M948_20375 [Virgibacillus sp. CM-4]|uniref:Uncharacterized protein n=1 Tax=Virgibacillus massiliensis TaxID=1462526 RepID=A0A024QH49_9BACI|nr:hypothetical protein M948_20375 [Virgibacillus sp. CM-4]CDQ41552.1 hypothetical protein BN990_03925 [Virgibacillus massiliensis]
MNFKITLRIPLLILIFSLVSAIIKYFPQIMIFKSNYFLNSAQFLFSVIIIFFILEKTNINKKEITISSAIVMVLSIFIIDYTLV